MSDPAPCPCGHRPTIEHHYKSGSTFVVCWVCGLRADPAPLFDTRTALRNWTAATAQTFTTDTTRATP